MIRGTFVHRSRALEYSFQPEGGGGTLEELRITNEREDALPIILHSVVYTLFPGWNNSARIVDAEARSASAGGSGATTNVDDARTKLAAWQLVGRERASEAVTLAKSGDFARLFRDFDGVSPTYVYLQYPRDPLACYVALFCQEMLACMRAHRAYVLNNEQARKLCAFEPEDARRFVIENSVAIVTADQGLRLAWATEEPSAPVGASASAPIASAPIASAPPNPYALYSIDKLMFDRAPLDRARLRPAVSIPWVECKTWPPPVGVANSKRIFYGGLTPQLDGTLVRAVFAWLREHAAVVLPCNVSSGGSFLLSEHAFLHKRAATTNNNPDKRARTTAESNNTCKQERCISSVYPHPSIANEFIVETSAGSPPRKTCERVAQFPFERGDAERIFTLDSPRTRWRVPHNQCAIVVFGNVGVHTMQDLHLIAGPDHALVWLSKKSSYSESDI